MPKGCPQIQKTIVCDSPLCGKTFSFQGGFAHFSRTNQHFCSRSCQNTTHGLAGTPKHKIWERTKRRAAKNGVIFNLTVHDIPDIPKNCPVLGILLQPNDKAGPLDSSPSIDRIIPLLGYVVGNVRIISNRANRIRSDATAEELRLIADDWVRIEKETSTLTGKKPKQGEEL